MKNNLFSSFKSTEKKLFDENSKSGRMPFFFRFLTGWFSPFLLVSYFCHASASIASDLSLPWNFFPLPSLPTFPTKTFFFVKFLPFYGDIYVVLAGWLVATRCFFSNSIPIPFYSLFFLSLLAQSVGQFSVFLYIRIQKESYCAPTRGIHSH